MSELEKLSDGNQTSCSKESKSAGCVLSCCQSCSYCSFTRASTKERSKPRQLSEQNQACQRCMLCKSMWFCPNCVQCPQCCRRTECRWQTSTILTYLARNGCESSGSICSKGWLHTSLQKQAPFNKDPFDSKWLCKSNQKHVLKRCSGQSHAQVGSRKGGCQVLTGFLQPTFSSSQTQQEMEANLRFKSAQLVPQYRYLQNGNSGDDPVVLEYRGVGHVARLQRRLLPHPNSHSQFTALPFGLATAPLEFTKVVKEVKLMAQARGIRIHQYLDDWLLRAPSPEICLQHTQTLLALCRQLGWVVNMTKSELVPKHVLNFVG